MSGVATNDVEYRDDEYDDGQPDEPVRIWLGTALAATAVALGVLSLIGVVSLFGADGPVTLGRWVLTIGPLLVAVAALAAWRRHVGDGSSGV